MYFRTFLTPPKTKKQNDQLKILFLNSFSKQSLCSADAVCEMLSWLFWSEARGSLNTRMDRLGLRSGDRKPERDIAQGGARAERAQHGAPRPLPEQPHLTPSPRRGHCNSGPGWRPGGSLPVLQPSMARQSPAHHRRSPAAARAPRRGSSKATCPLPPRGDLPREQRLRTRPLLSLFPPSPSSKSGRHPDPAHPHRLPQGPP